MGVCQTKNPLQSKETIKKYEKGTLCMGEYIYQWYIQQGVNFQNV